jgi:hypothetical protein
MVATTLPGFGPPKPYVATSRPWLETPTAIQFGISEVNTVAAQSFNGMYAIINGVIRQVPINPSPRKTNTGLSANTTYFAYLEDANGLTIDNPTNIQLVLNTNTPIADSYNAISVDNTDHRRTLVGMAHTNSSGTFECSLQRQLCATWNWRLPNQCIGRLSSDTAMTAKTAFTVVNSGAKAEFVSWGYGQTASVHGAVKGDTAGMQVRVAVIVDYGMLSQQTLDETKITLRTVGDWSPITHAAQFFTTFSPTPNNPDDGYHTLDLVAWPTGGTATFSAGSGVSTLVWQ